MFRARAATAFATTALLACAGCSGAESSSSPEPEPAADGRTISGSGYEYSVPKNWGAPPQTPSGFDPDSLAVDLEDDDGFTDNVNVIVSPAAAWTAEQAEVSAKDELTSAGAEDVTVQDRVTVAGSEVAHLSAEMSVNDTTYRVEQFYPTDNDQTLIVTFSFSDSVGATDRAEVTDTVLSSWSWTD